MAPINSVPKISHFVETVQSKALAIKHLMKTKIGYDELLSDEVQEELDIHKKNHKNNLVPPLYEQCHQSNVCVL